jgi:hypothetical protein
MKRKLIRPTLVILVAVGALLVVGGIAYATIPDGGGVIHGCYLKGLGTLRVVDTDKGQACLSKLETPLNWSQTGPQGQQGPTGATGATGATGVTGATGPSDVWSVDGYNAGNKNVPPAPSEETLATTATLPAGSYSVQAETSLENNTSASMDYVCDIVDSSANIYGESRASTFDWVTLPVQAVVTLASPDTISFECTATGALSEAFNWQLSAIEIGTVHS